MATPTPTSTASTRAIPESVDSTRAKLVYLHLERERETTVDAVADALDVRKLGLFPVLSTLEARGHVERDDAQTIRFAD